jgi:hypothetical protein
MNESDIDNKVLNTFKNPLLYVNDRKEVKKDIIEELELVTTIDPNETPIYEHIFKPQSSSEKIMLKQLVKSYTVNKEYLKNNQKIINSFETDKLTNLQKKHSIDSYFIEDLLKSWKEIKGETGFCQKYLYIDWEFAKDLNNNPSFLQLMSIYSIISPILSLCLPIFILIIPFFIIKMKGLDCNFKEYIDILKVLVKNNALTKIFTEFNNVTIGQKIYMIVSAVFYLFSIYQNILVCVRFYSNLKKIHDYLFKFKQFINYSIELIDYYSSLTTSFNTHNNFNCELQSYRCNIIETIQLKLNNISSFEFSFKKIGEIGNILYIFYQFHTNALFERNISYLLGFTSYVQLFNQLVINVKHTGQMNKADFSDKKVDFSLTQAYYPKFIGISRTNDEPNPIKNNIDLSQNMIITGPNASGKTTTLKTTLINILLTQQFGIGCYKSCILRPFDNIHCYLNIPDTSGRDSLFQAEARRCKEIIDSVNNLSNESHFCIFDELYSGTNPEEAVSSAYAFMDFLINKENVKCMLTTHYIKLCKKLRKNKNIKNYCMKTDINDGEIKYKYIIVEGISKIKGGLKVLKEMNYPKEILDKTMNSPFRKG